MRTLALGLCALATGATASAETLIVGNKNEHTVSFIDLARGEEAARRETGVSPHEIAVSPDGTLALVVSYRTQNYEGNTLHLFDVPTARKLGEISLGDHKGPHGLKWIPGGDRVIVTTEITRNVVVADVSEQVPVATVDTDQDGSHMVALSPDGRRAFVSNIGSGSFTVINLETFEKIADVKAGEGTEAIAVTPDGKEVWVGNNGSRSVMIFDAATLEKRAEFATEGVPIRVEISPDGALAAVSEPDLDRVSVYDAATRARVATIDLAGVDARTPVTMLFSPDGGRLWVAATGSAKVVEIATEGWSIIRTLPAGRGSDGLGYSPLSVQTE